MSAALRKEVEPVIVSRGRRVGEVRGRVKRRNRRKAGRRVRRGVLNYDF